MNSKRTFIAIDISDEAREVCQQHIQHLRLSHRDVRVGWDRSEKLHVTLKFLGNTSLEQMTSLESGLQRIASDTEPFTLRLSSPGIFGTRGRPRVLWIGMSDRDQALSPLFQNLETVAESLGFPREDRGFSPHLTIGRIREPASSRALVETHLEAHIEPVEFEVSSLTIYESELRPTGSVYSVVSRLQLR